MEFNFFLVILTIIGALALVVALFLFRTRSTAARLCGLILVATAVWGISYGIQFITKSLEGMYFWTSVQYIGIAAIPPLWLLFSIYFAGKERLVTKNRALLLFLIPLATVTLVSTNEYHNLHYHSTWLNLEGPFPVMEIQPGGWYWVHMAYFYVLLAIGIYFIVQKYRQSDKLFRRQNAIILAGAFLPAIFNLIYLAGYHPFGLGIDVTPFAFCISSLTVAFGLIRYQLFNIVPIAREKIIEAMAEGIVVTDPHGRIVDANPAMQRLLANVAEQPIGKELEALLPSLKLPADKNYRSRGEIIELHFTDEGTGKNYSVTITPIIEKLKLTGKIYVCKDVTEQKQHEAKLEALNKLKDKLFSIISHDLRSPLVSLMDLLSLTNEGMISDDELREFLPQLQKNVGYTSSLLENLLQWSKSQLQNAVTRPVSIDLEALTARMIDSFQDRAAEKNISLVSNITTNLPLYADQDMIEAVYRNLLSNAIKFCNSGDKITISSELTHEHTTICIADTGVGISEPDLKRIFQADTFTKRGTKNEQGTGLGLLLAKDFVEKNHGRIWVESKLGEGSCFYFSLPNVGVPAEVHQ